MSHLVTHHSLSSSIDWCIVCNLKLSRRYSSPTSSIVPPSSPSTLFLSLCLTTTSNLSSALQIGLQVRFVDTHSYSLRTLSDFTAFLPSLSYVGYPNPQLQITLFPVAMACSATKCLSYFHSLALWYDSLPYYCDTGLKSRRSVPIIIANPDCVVKTDHCDLAKDFEGSEANSLGSRHWHDDLSQSLSTWLHCCDDLDCSIHREKKLAQNIATTTVVGFRQTVLSYT